MLAPPCQDWSDFKLIHYRVSGILRTIISGSLCCSTGLLISLWHWLLLFLDIAPLKPWGCAPNSPVAGRAPLATVMVAMSDRIEFARCPGPLCFSLPGLSRTPNRRRHVDFLFIEWLSKPAWMWLGFFAIVSLLLAFDLGVLHRTQREIGVRESLLLSAGYLAIGVGFGGIVWWQLGDTAGIQYLTGFVVEKSLALDNVFVIALIFGFFAIPRQYQHRVLFWGILGVIALRAVMIGVGATLVSEFSWVLYVFAAFLILTGVKMLWLTDKKTDLSENVVLKFIRRRFRVTDDLHGERFIVTLPDPKTGQMVRFMTPLALALILIEIADVIFAVDSVPAIFAITTDPYLVYTSNIFAILGLRALYFALDAILHRFAYLKQALAVLLIFIGSKIFVADLLGLEKFPAAWSLGGTFVILTVGVVYSLWRTRVSNNPELKGIY